MSYLDVDGARVFVTDEPGGDPPLLLVHGWGSDSSLWALHLPLLAPRRRVVALDLRGHGRSSAPAGAYDPSTFAADSVAMLDAVGVGEVVVVGHSMGGQVAVELALSHADRVKAIVCVDPGYGLDDAIAPMLASWGEGLRGEEGVALAKEIDGASGFTPASPQWLRTYLQRSIEATPRHVLSAAWDGMFLRQGAIGLRTASEPVLRSIRCPVLSIWRYESQAAWERSVLQHPASRAIAWEGSGHYLHHERPAEFVHVATRWLDELGM